MFNFNKSEKDDTSMIAFTVDDESGIVNAHSVRDSAITVKISSTMK